MLSTVSTDQFFTKARFSLGRSISDPDVRKKNNGNMPVRRSSSVSESAICKKKSRRRQDSSPVRFCADLSVLIIGATGQTGLACVQRFARHEKKPKVHAFCRDKSKLSDHMKTKCTSVVEGDAKDEDDIKRALKKTKATVVVVCIGNGREDKATNIRTASANALVNVMKKRKYKHVRALVISRINNRIGFAVRMLQFRFASDDATESNRNLRRVLKDHKGQEDAFLSSVPERITIVRPTAISDRKARGTVRELKSEDRDLITTMSTPRADLASWVVEEICCGIPVGGRVTNITASRR